MVYFNVKGILAPVFTPVNSCGQLNLIIVPQYAKHLSDNGVDGVLVGGTSGEAMCLNVEERKSLLNAWLIAAKPLGLKVMAQVGGAPMPDVIELASHAESVKADGMLTLPELYFKPRTPEKLVDYLEDISNAAPSLPVIYYHFPAMTGVDMNMVDLYQEARKRIPNFKGFKADLGVATQLEDILDLDHRVFIANHMLVPSVLLGNNSSIATVTNMFPSLVRYLVNSAQGDLAINGIMRKQAKLNSLVAAVTHHGQLEFVPAMKAAMELTTDISVGNPRPPLSTLSSQQKKEMQMRLDALCEK